MQLKYFVTRQTSKILCINQPIRIEMLFSFALMCVLCLRRYCWRSVGLLSAAETIDFHFVHARKLSNDTHNLLLKEQSMNMIEMIILTKEPNQCISSLPPGMGA